MYICLKAEMVPPFGRDYKGPNISAVLMIGLLSRMFRCFMSRLGEGFLCP